MSAISEPIASSHEREIRADVSKEVPWELVTAFSRIVRESGTEGEWKAARYIYDKLKSWGANVTMLEPELRQLRSSAIAFGRRTSMRIPRSWAAH